MYFKPLETQNKASFQLRGILSSIHSSQNGRGSTPNLVRKPPNFVYLMKHTLFNHSRLVSQETRHFHPSHVQEALRLFRLFGLGRGKRAGLMPLHLTKVAYGAASLDDMRTWFANHGKIARLTTCYLPKRFEEILPKDGEPGGSLGLLQ